MMKSILALIGVSAILVGIYHVWNKWCKEAEEDGVIDLGGQGK